MHSFFQSIDAIKVVAQSKMCWVYKCLYIYKCLIFEPTFSVWTLESPSQFKGPKTIIHCFQRDAQYIQVGGAWHHGLGYFGTRKHNSSEKPDSEDVVKVVTEVRCPQQLNCKNKWQVLSSFWKGYFKNSTILPTNTITDDVHKLIHTLDHEFKKGMPHTIHTNDNLLHLNVLHSKNSSL